MCRRNWRRCRSARLLVVEPNTTPSHTPHSGLLAVAAADDTRPTQFYDQSREGPTYLTTIKVELELCLSLQVCLGFLWCNVVSVVLGVRGMFFFLRAWTVVATTEEGKLKSWQVCHKDLVNQLCRKLSSFDFIDLDMEIDKDIGIDVHHFVATSCKGAVSTAESEHELFKASFRLLDCHKPGRPRQERPGSLIL